ncbi:Putative deoxyribonuclease YjjV [hydrothermal vent metagenome]|uniref:Deoxyribonuclease YjjV n=1 Tax=hydrothermal vent metagenome TaxID=652676 RepID=A0A3B0WPP5_9ZZZZ
MPNTSSKIQLIDSHCHLDFEIFDSDREQVLQRAKGQHITDIIVPGTESQYWQRISKLCNNKTLHASYGLHPYWISSHSKKDLTKLDHYIEENKPVAVGECGLDFRPQQTGKEVQIEFYEAQLDIAANHQLPVVIHSVKATESIIQAIKKHKDLTGMVHSFSGSLEQAKRLIDLNFYISISGSVTHENAKKMRAVANEIPLTSLLLETDAPDQPDSKNKNNRNEPAYLINTLDTIAELREETREEIAYQTTLNAKQLFSI